MNKQHVRKTMLALSAQALDHAAGHYQRFLANTRLDPNEPIENDEQAQAEFQGRLAESFEQPLHDAEAKLELLARLDFGPKAQVGPGAVVAVDGRHLVIGVATGPFRCDGIEFIGISPDAPFFKAIEGLEAGDEALFQGRSFAIERIW